MFDKVLLIRNNDNMFWFDSVSKKQAAEDNIVIDQVDAAVEVEMLDVSTRSMKQENKHDRGGGGAAAGSSSSRRRNHPKNPTATENGVQTTSTLHASSWQHDRE